jgi:hypothetical protein
MRVQVSKTGETRALNMGMAILAILHHPNQQMKKIQLVRMFYSCRYATFMPKLSIEGIKMNLFDNFRNLII